MNHQPNESEPVILELITYNREKYDKYVSGDADDLLQNLHPDRVNWINIDGKNLAPIIEKIQSHFALHFLVIDDILSDQRPKAEEYDDYLFVTLKMLYRIHETQIDYEQISFVLGHNFLLTFQEKEGDLFDPFRERIRLDQGKVRKKQADYLLYRLIDITVDNYYTVLENIGEQIEQTEGNLRGNNLDVIFKKILQLKKDLIYLHQALYPLRDAINSIIKEESSLIREENFRYFSDVYDHVVHLIDSLNTYRDLTAGLMEMHINTQNRRLNDVIRLLTIISTIFIPLTFIVGVYGMNFRYFPELEWKYSYPVLWVIMLGLAGLMVAFFKYKKWL